MNTMSELAVSVPPDTLDAPPDTLDAPPDTLDAPSFDVLIHKIHKTLEMFILNHDCVGFFEDLQLNNVMCSRVTSVLLKRY